MYLIHVDVIFFETESTVCRYGIVAGENVFVSFNFRITFSICRQSSKLATKIVFIQLVV